jgi:hypothetical protein
MSDLKDIIQYKIDDKQSYKLAYINVLKNNLKNDEKLQIDNFIKKYLSNLKDSHRIIFNFSQFGHVDREDLLYILDCYKNMYKQKVDDNIKKIVAIIPNFFISNAARIFLYFENIGIPIKIVSTIDEAYKIIEE